VAQRTILGRPKRTFSALIGSINRCTSRFFPDNYITVKSWLTDSFVGFCVSSVYLIKGISAIAATFLNDSWEGGQVCPARPPS
jgi:hypothetical protein